MTMASDNHLETLHLIWLDASVNDEEENIDAQKELRLIIRQFRTFPRANECQRFIENLSKDDRIFLIVSGSIGQEIIPRIHHLPQIFAIYLYCMNQKKYEEWAKPYRKVKGILTALEDLILQIRNDLKKRTELPIDEPIRFCLSPNNLRSTDRSTMALNGEFLYSQLLIDALLRMKSNVNEKTQFVRFCETLYQNNPNELKLLKEFDQTYQSHRAIWWYTRETSLYRLLNKALRRQNLDLLLLLRFFLRDMEQQLAHFQCSNAVRVYRGQLMSMDEINQLKNSLGSFISISSFFSTSLDPNVAKQFLRTFPFHHDQQKVLFEIDAQPSIGSNKPFSNIGPASFHPHEQEILFMLGSIFRLNSVQKDAADLWLVRLTLINGKDEEFQRFEQQLKVHYRTEIDLSPILALGNLLFQMGKYDAAEKFYQQLLNELPNDHPDRSRCFHALGIIMFIREKYSESVRWHEESLKALPSDDPRQAETFNCLACVYQKRGENARALEYYQKASLIWITAFGDDYFQMADCLNNIGCIYEIEGDYFNALEHHRKALEIRKKHLQEDHRDLAASYNNIGNVYFAMENYDDALKSYQTALDLKMKTLPSEHISIASTLSNIGLVLEKKRIFDQALSHYQKAMSILRATFPSNHSQIRQADEDIQRVAKLR